MRFLHLIGLTLFFVFTLADNPQTITLSGTIRDFANADSGLPQAHPDFNSFLTGVDKGMVQNTIGVDRKPVWASLGNPRAMTSADTFSQWFRDVSGVNIDFEFSLTATYDATKEAYVYSNTSFFPIDGEGYGNENKGHNFGFCLEMHTQFTYVAGQVFDFSGDDDVWVFVNDQLEIDLGGTHVASSESIQLDSLGLVVGNTYTLDLFFCERHVVASDLMFSTSIQLSPCGKSDYDHDGTPDQCDFCPQGALAITADVSQTITGLSIAFNLTVTGNYTGAGYTITVDYGDGTTQTISPGGSLLQSHTYASYGTFSVSLTLSNAGTGCQNSTNQYTVTLYNPCGSIDTDKDGFNDQCDSCPLGDLTLVLQATPSMTKFTASVVAIVSGKYTGSGYNVLITYGDGNSDLLPGLSSGIQSTHTYQSGGTYTITGTIQYANDDYGCSTASDSISITLNQRTAPVCTTPSPM